MDLFLALVSIALVTAGLIGQAFEMKKIRNSIKTGEELTQNIFTDRRNFKWYAVIGTGLILWYVAENQTVPGF